MLSLKSFLALKNSVTVRNILGAFLAVLLLSSNSFATVQKVPMAPLLTEVAEKYLTETQGLALDAFTVMPISASLVISKCDSPIHVEPRGGRLETLTMTCSKPVYWKRHIKVKLGKVQNDGTQTKTALTPLPTLSAKKPAQQAVVVEKPKLQQPQKTGAKVTTSSQPAKKWDVVILKTPLKRGHILQSEDVELKTVDRNPGGNAYSDISQVLGLELKFALQFKHVLRYSDVQKQAMIRKGDSVKLVSKGKGFRISMDGVAQNDASVGQRIKATNASSGKDVYGILQKDKTVLVREFK